jgi:hypothetical protein
MLKQEKQQHDKPPDRETSGDGPHLGCGIGGCQLLHKGGTGLCGHQGK